MLEPSMVSSVQFNIPAFSDFFVSQSNFTRRANLLPNHRDLTGDVSPRAISLADPDNGGLAAESIIIADLFSIPPAYPH